MANQRILTLAHTLAKLPPTINEMELAARRCLVSPTGEKARGYCQRWARTTYELIYGNKFDAFRASTAKEAGEKWANSRYALADPTKHAVGDILYFLEGHGGAGHVVIRIQGHQVAENSIVHWDGSDGRGVRPLTAFGTPDVVVRLWKTEVKK